MKGFTIMEVVIVMMLSALLAVLVISGLGFFQRVFGVVVKTGDAQNEINRLYFAMSNDIEKAEQVVFDGELQLVFDNKHLTTYEMTEDQIIRKTHNDTDTFNVGGIVEDIIIVDGSDHLVGFFQFSCFNGELKFPIFFHKEYPMGLIIQNQRTWQ